MLSPKCACEKCRLDFSPSAMKVPQPLLERVNILYITYLVSSVVLRWPVHQVLIREMVIQTIVHSQDPSLNGNSSLAVSL